MKAINIFFFVIIALLKTNVEVHIFEGVGVITAGTRNKWELRWSAWREKTAFLIVSRIISRSLDSHSWVPGWQEAAFPGKNANGLTGTQQVRLLLSCKAELREEAQSSFHSEWPKQRESRRTYLVHPSSGVRDLWKREKKKEEVRKKEQNREEAAIYMHTQFAVQCLSD